MRSYSIAMPYNIIPHCQNCFDCLSPIVCTYREPIMRKLDKRGVPPYSLFNGALCSILNSSFYAFGFHKSKTLFSNHDNGTVKHIWRHLNGKYEQYIDNSINHRHMVYCCINYVLVFDLFFMILLIILEAPLIVLGFQKI